MGPNHPQLPKERESDWDKAWDVVNRLGAARMHIEHDTGAKVDAALATPSESSAPTPEGRPPRRPLSVWILIGALWISIGMIVSAAIVTVVFLA